MELLVPLLWDGQPVNLDHLAPIRRKVNVQLLGGFSKAVDVEFHFSNHCYSRLPHAGEEIPPDLFVADGSVEHPRHRIFDRVRYDLSLRLIHCLDALIDQDQVVTRSKHHNFFHMTTTQVLADGTQVEFAYYIFMSAKKIEQPNQPKFLKIFVETAYPSDPAEAGPTGGASRALGVMLGEFWAPRKR
jgi:hypothetical protein